MNLTGHQSDAAEVETDTTPAPNLLVDSLPYSDQIREKALTLAPPDKEQIAALERIAEQLDSSANYIFGRGTGIGPAETDANTELESIYVRTHRNVEELVAAVQSIDTGDVDIPFLEEAREVVARELPQLRDFMHIACLGVTPSTGDGQSEATDAQSSETLWGSDFGMLATSMSQIQQRVDSYSEVLQVLVALDKNSGDDTLSSLEAEQLEDVLDGLQDVLLDTIVFSGLDGSQSARLIASLVSEPVEFYHGDRISRQSTLLTDLISERYETAMQMTPDGDRAGLRNMAKLLPELDCYLQLACRGYRCNPSSNQTDELLTQAIQEAIQGVERDCPSFYPGTAYAGATHPELLDGEAKDVTALDDADNEDAPSIPDQKKKRRRDPLTQEVAAELNGHLLQLGEILASTIEPCGLKAHQADWMLTRFIEEDETLYRGERLAHRSETIASVFAEFCCTTKDDGISDLAAEGIAVLQGTLVDFRIAFQETCAESGKCISGKSTDRLSSHLDMIAREATALHYALQSPEDRPEEYTLPVNVQEETAEVVAEVEQPAQRVIDPEDITAVRELTGQVQELALQVLKPEGEDLAQLDGAIPEEPEEIIALIERIKKELQSAVEENKNNTPSTGGYRPELRAVNEHLPAFARCAQELLIIEDTDSTTPSLSTQIETRESVEIMQEATYAVNQLVVNKDGITALLVPTEEVQHAVTPLDPDAPPADLLGRRKKLSPPTAQDIEAITAAVTRFSQALERLELIDPGTTAIIEELRVSHPEDLTEFAIDVKREAFEHFKNSEDDTSQTEVRSVLQTEAPQLRDAFRITSRGYTLSEENRETGSVAGVRIDIRGQSYDAHFAQIQNSLEKIEAAIEPRTPLRDEPAPPGFLARIFNLGG